MRNQTKTVSKTAGKLVLISAFLLLAACGKQTEMASVTGSPDAPTTVISLPQGNDTSVVQQPAGVDTGAPVTTTLSYQGAGL